MPYYPVPFVAPSPLVALNPALNAYPAGRHLGNPGGLSAVDTDLIPAKIMKSTTIFGVLGTMVTWIYDLLAEQAIGYLTVPIPTISSPPAITNLNAGDGGQTATPVLPIPLPVLALTECANSMLLIDDCEANIWDEFVGASVTSTIDAVVFKCGTHSAKLDVADAEAVGRLATLDIASTDLTTYNYIKVWVRSSVAINAADLHFLLDEHAQCVSALKTLDIGALVANTWTEVSLALGDASALGAIISIGINMSVDKGAFLFYIDQVRATKGD